ncbi:hypothetical protein [Lysobacter niastensis]|uniref:Uncharacterized protein n=1 Tax=Lysobacter niastensis TaxID=380629 RepID=A0ABS0B985_9GAMM|nr:hypothetical protein [Lysobacter niastensis]MBF6025573.1 hypothetical protein [Lysobacter niastensis]
MENSVITAMAALFGSLIGGLTTLATAWLSQRYTTRNQRVREEIAKREALYGAYIDEASARMIDALEHEISDANQIVRMYGLYCRIQLVCTQPVLEEAERLLKRTAEVYAMPNITLADLVRGALESKAEGDPIVAFSRACREELETLQRYL